MIDNADPAGRGHEHPNNAKELQDRITRRRANKQRTHSYTSSIGDEPMTSDGSNIPFLLLVKSPIIYIM